MLEETKRKISEHHKKFGVGKWMKGRHLSEITKKKLSLANKGRPSWNKGKKCPQLGHKYFGEKSANWRGGITTYARKLWFNRQRRVMKLGNGGYHTLEEWEILKAQYNWTCPACKKQESEISLTEDHIIPLSKGGSDNIENIQPLCQSCNCKKHAKIIKYIKT